MTGDAKMLAAASLAAAVFDKMRLEPDQDPAKEIVTVYKRMVRRLSAANAALEGESSHKLGGDVFAEKG